MKRIIPVTLILSALGLTACLEDIESPATEPRSGLIGDWQSLSDDNYVLKFNTETYREFYAAEEMSRDQWQPVKSCDVLEPVEKMSSIYGGFQIWTKDTDSRICYTISNWSATNVSLTYAGTTSSYKRID